MSFEPLELKNADDMKKAIKDMLDKDPKKYAQTIAFTMGVLSNRISEEEFSQFIDFDNMRKFIKDEQLDKALMGV